MREKIEYIAKRYRSRELSPEAVKQFSRPANYCQFCGNPIQPTGNEILDRWQARWSVCIPCSEAIEDRLDRESHMASARRNHPLYNSSAKETEQ